MPVPSLPLDVWFRIATFMDAPSLSALSEVNQALNNIVMDKTHFQRLLTVPQTEHTPLIQLYRRMSALHHPPNDFSTTQLSSNLKMVCVTQDTLLLVDIEKHRFIAFPSGLTVDAEDILGLRRRTIRGFMLNNLESRVLCLPAGLVAFQCGAHCTRLAILDTNTGEVFAHKLRRRRKPNMAIVHGKSLLVAGNNAEWIMYRVDENTVEIKDWRDGTVVKEINLNEDTKFLIGECPAIDDSSVVGLAVKKMNSSVNEIHVKGFDGVEMMFKVDESKVVNSILRSADKKTHVLITANGILCARPTGFIAHRKYENSEKWWHGAFRFGGMLYPELKENGRVISVTRKPFLAQSRCGLRCLQLTGCPLWVELMDGDANWCTTQDTCISALKGRSPPVWIRRMREGGLAILVKRPQGVIEMVQFERDGENVKEKLLKSWTIQNLTNVCVVADHFVVATSDDKQMQLNLHLLHFDKFCSGGGGVYACPLVGLLTYCYFPEDIREREPFHANKRRRISDGSGRELTP